MDGWTRLVETGDDEQRLRWLIRHHAEDMVRAGVAMKFGREWRIHLTRLPEYLRERTLEMLGRESAEARP